MTLSNRQLANIAVEACVDSYVEYGVLMVTGEAMPRVFSIRELNAHANIYRGPDCNVLCYRGTDDVADWVGNLRFTMQAPRKVKPYRNMLPFVPKANPLIHHGFWLNHGRLSMHVSKAMESMDQDKPWIVTGHSLGGAMASISVLREVYNTAPYLVTFGAPRWGNRDACWLASQYTERMLRFRNGADIVPLLPAPIGRWKHACPEISLNGSSSSRPVGAHNIYDYRIGLQRYNG